MAVRKGTIYEQFLMECLACAIRTLAQNTGQPYGFWVSCIFGQGGAAMRDRLSQRNRLPSAADAQLEQIREQMARESALATYADPEE
jgi:hypothetical protein